MKQIDFIKLIPLYFSISGAALAMEFFSGCVEGPAGN